MADRTQGAIDRAIEASKNAEDPRLADLVGTGRAPKGRTESVGTASRSLPDVDDADRETAEQIAKRFRAARARKSKRGQYMKSAGQMRRALRKRLIKRCPSFGHKHVTALVDDVLPV